MFRQIGPLEIALILAVLLLLFGAKRLPDLTRSIGRSMRIFKSEVREMRSDDTAPGTHDADSASSRQLEGRVVEPVRETQSGEPHRTQS